MSHLESEPQIAPLVHWDQADRNALRRLVIDDNNIAVINQHATLYQSAFFDHSAIEWLTGIAQLALSCSLEVLAGDANTETEDVLSMPLTGTLKKCIHYAGILLTQHGYDHVSIYFSPNTKQYDVLTDAEIERRTALNTMADRGVVMRVTIYQLQQILDQQQLTLGLADESTDRPTTNQTGQLARSSNTAGNARSDGSTEGRHRADTDEQELNTDLVEPSKLPID
jgi:hypothetical protein